MKLKDGVESRGSSDPWYDILDGGYFNPEEFLDNQEDIDAVYDAMKVLSEFKELVVEEI